MKRKISYLFCLFICFLLTGKVYGGSVKKMSEGGYILENEYLEIEINPNGGMQGLRYKPQDIDLAKRGQASFHDRIYQQKYKEDKRVVDIEYFHTYPYEVKVLKETGKEVSIEVSARSLSNIFSGLLVRKVYTLKDNIPILFVEHSLENTSDTPIDAGVWVTNFFRVTGAVPEKNKYYTPTENGLQEVIHPGVEATPDGVWTLTPVADWKGIIGDSSKTGVVTVFDAPHLSGFLDWYSVRGDSTYEWVIKQQKIEPKKIFTTSYKLIPVSEFNRVDNVIDGRMVSSIEFLPEKVKVGRETDILYKLVGYDKEAVNLKMKVSMGGRVITENLLDGVKLGEGLSFKRNWKQKIEKEGIYKIEIDVVKGNKLLGSTKRYLIVGDFEVKEKVKPLAKIKEEEKFWLGMQLARNPEWQDVKLISHRITPQPKQKDLDVNLVGLGDFEEKDFKKYVQEKWSVRFGEGLKLTEETAHSGKQSIKIKDRSASFSTPMCKVESGKEYKVTFWVKMADRVSEGYSISSEYLLYKESRKKLNIMEKVSDKVKISTSDWEKVEKVVSIPEDVEWVKLTLTTPPVKGSIYIDDISISRMPLTEKEKREEKAYLYSKSLSTYFKVNEEYETPHIKWLKPYSKGKIKVLFLGYLWRLDDVSKRDVVELAQRVDIDYKFIPLLFGNKDVELHIMDVINDELKKDYGVIVINKLNFKSVDEKLVDDLLSVVKEGKGLVMIDCKNLPKKIDDLLSKKNLIKTPELFLNLPEVISLRTETQLPLICKMSKFGEGIISNISVRNSLYPCVPSEKIGEQFTNFYGREIPYWEYKLFPVIKSLVYLSRKESDVNISKFTTQETTLNVKIASNITLNAVLEVSFNDKYKQEEKLVKYQLKLQKGDNELSFNLPKLSGGLHLADYILKDSKGFIYDFGSYAFESPLSSEIKQVRFTSPNSYFKTGEEIKVEIELSNILEGTKLNWYVEDATYKRIIKKGQVNLKGGEGKTDISFKIDYPLGIIYYLFVKLEKDDEVENINMVEFSMPFNYPPADELLGYGWFAYQGALGFNAWKEGGLDVMVNSSLSYPGLFRVLSAVNLRPSVYGALTIAGDVDVGDRYRGDLGREGDDVIRKPCYSDPNWWNKIREVLTKKIQENNTVYYGAKDYSLSDESFLGANVCFSEYCLKDFRAYLKEGYKDLKELNSAWKTSFKSWEEVTPIRIEGVNKEKSNLAVWLDHKMFMTTVFAKLGKRIKNIAIDTAPDMEIQIGFSGMQNPGFSYNWWEIMKYMTSLQHYEGMQKDLIRSFCQPGTRYGMWVGYAGEHIDAEKYSRYHVWGGLFNQANGYMHFYSGYALLGDLSFARNTKYVLEELKVAKQGIDKALLSSEQVCDIGLHYSHSSLFACWATLGSNIWSGAVNSWSAMINDLGLNFKFVSNEQLEKGGLSKDEYKVFVLPVSVCLSDKETLTLRKYVESGGILVADYGAGVYNQHGNKRTNKLLWDLFGIEKEEDSEIIISGSGIKLKDVLTEGLTARDIKLRFGENGLKLTTSKAYGDTGDEKAPAIIINNFGKGKAIFLNCVINDYAQVVLGGVGGELSEVKKGAFEVNEQLKGFAREIFQIGGVTPEVIITTPQGVDLQSVTKTSMWKNGDIRYVGLLNEPENLFNKIQPEEIIDLNITFRNKGYIYDVKEKKYLGVSRGNKQFKTKISPTIANIYSILPYRVSGISVTPDKKSYKAGDMAVLSVKVRTSGGEAGNHVAYVEVTGPDKKLRSYYTQKVILEKGGGKLNIPISFNDDLGLWSVNVRDVASGVTQKVDIRVTN